MFLTGGVRGGVRWGFQRKTLTQSRGGGRGWGGWLLRGSEPFRVEGKELAENGPGKVDWPRNARQRSGHWIQQAVEGSALGPLLEDLCASPLAEGGQPDSYSDLHLMHFHTAVHGGSPA